MGEARDRGAPFLALGVGGVAVRRDPVAREGPAGAAGHARRGPGRGSRARRRPLAARPTPDAAPETAPAATLPAADAARVGLRSRGTARSSARAATPEGLAKQARRPREALEDAEATGGGREGRLPSRARRWRRRSSAARSSRTSRGGEGAEARQRAGDAARAHRRQHARASSKPLRAAQRGRPDVEGRQRGTEARRHGAGRGDEQDRRPHEEGREVQERQDPGTNETYGEAERRIRKEGKERARSLLDADQARVWDRSQPTRSSAGSSAGDTRSDRGRPASRSPCLAGRLARTSDGLEPREERARARLRVRRPGCRARRRSPPRRRRAVAPRRTAPRMWPSKRVLDVAEPGEQAHGEELAVEQRERGAREHAAVGELERPRGEPRVRARRARRGRGRRWRP